MNKLVQPINKIKIESNGAAQVHIANYAIIKRYDQYQNNHLLYQKKTTQVLLQNEYLNSSRSFSAHYLFQNASWIKNIGLLTYVYPPCNSVCWA